VGSALDGLITCGASQLEKLMIGGKWLIENNDYCRVLSRDVMEKYKILAKKIQN
jgi:8-oxoguanine deaminase